MKTLRMLMMNLKTNVSLLVLTMSSGCSFNFELTSQKTALENQIMGSYKELDDEVLLMASVRGVNKDGSVSEAKVQSDAAKVALNARQNQSFNRDDVDEFKTRQILGESRSGQLVVLPNGTGLAESASESDLKFARVILEQENKDREVIVKRVVATNEKLSEKDLLEAKRVYRKTILDESPVGTWFENESGVWQRKVGGQLMKGSQQPAVKELQI